jgi:uncharacterized phage-like protein YoqJ
MTTIAVTGHRPDKCHVRDPWSLRSADKLTEFAKLELERLEPDRVITGMALGWDLSIAAAAWNLKIPYVAAVPCDNQQSRWTPYWQSAYETLLRDAAAVVVVSPGPYAAWKMLRRNVWMLEQITEPEDVLLALWDGSSGGTGHCCSKAMHFGRRIENCWERWKEYRAG